MTDADGGIWNPRESLGTKIEYYLMQFLVQELNVIIIIFCQVRKILIILKQKFYQNIAINVKGSGRFLSTYKSLRPHTEQCRIKRPWRDFQNPLNFSKISSRFLYTFFIKLLQIFVQSFVSSSENCIKNFAKFWSKCFFVSLWEVIPTFFSKF